MHLLSNKLIKLHKGKTLSKPVPLFFLIMIHFSQHEIEQLQQELAQLKQTPVTSNEE